MPARRLMAAFAFGATALSAGAGLSAFGAAAHAQGAYGQGAYGQGIFEQPKYAAIVVDAKTGEVLYARRADAPRVPASVTKVMTLYMVFEAMANGKLSPSEQIGVSQHAANQAPSKLGLRPGETISVDDAIRAAAVKSANDMAVVLAERVGGTEDRFAEMMTQRAQDLGMRGTRFINANGLPDRRGSNITTARDLAILSRAVLRDYPQFYSYFSQREFAWHGRSIANHNHLLAKMPGVDGIKTGYTAAAGFNLAASAVRDGRRLITVVLGGPSTAARDNNVETLLTAGFDVLNRRSRGQTITLAQNLGVPDDSGAGFARPAVEPGEARPVMVAEAREPARAAAPAYAPAMALAAMAPIPNPTFAPAAIPSTATLVAIAEAAKPKLYRASITRKVEQDDDENASGNDCAPVDSARQAARGRHQHRVVAKACTRAPAKLQLAKAEIDCDAVKKSRRKACEHEAAKAERAVQIAKADAVDDCDKVKKNKRKACETKAHKAEAVQFAKAESAAESCAKLNKSRRKACEAKAEVQVAKLETKAAKGKAKAVDAGDYTIQVGSFGDRHQAQAHMEKVSEKFARLVATAAGQVSHAAGNYRVRFRGFSSETAAKSACHKLSSKGERCMVVAEG